MIFTLAQSAQEATKVFRTFTDGRPRLIPTGIPGVDGVLGGMFPGSTAVLGAGTGVGKSSVCLLAAMTSGGQQTPVDGRGGAGILSLEDGHDVLGSRAISLVSGVDNLKIRMKNLTRDETRRIHEAIERLSEQKVHVAYRIGHGIDAAEKALHELADQGCQMLYVDYLQKLRGGTADRRNEVAGNFTKLQGVASERNCAILFVSQVARQMDPTQMPRRHMLKESGDLENEARLIVMLNKRADNVRLLDGLIDKSTVGGEGTTFVMERTSRGLVHVSEESEDF